jgi:hypothetical protein
MFHSGMARARVAIGGSSSLTMTVTFDGGVEDVCINVNRFVSRVRDHFMNYVATLREPTNEPFRDAFMRAWDLHNPSIVRSLPGLVP